MYQTGMYVKEVLEAFNGGIWNAELKYDCSTDRYTARLRLSISSPETAYEKTAAFEVNGNRMEEQSLRTAMQLWLTLTDLERELISEHADELIRDGMGNRREADLIQNIRETILQMENTNYETISEKAAK